MKRVLALLLCAAMMLLAACSSGNSSGGEGGESKAGSVAPSESKTESVVPESSEVPESKAESQAEVKDQGKIGDYEISIESARISKDYEKKPVVIVKYKFTNNSDDTTSFIAATHSQAFQDGVELELAMVMDDKTYDAGNSMKDIKKGASIEVEEAYLLSGKSDVEVEVSELISLSDEKVAKTFKYSELK